MGRGDARRNAHSFMHFSVQPCPNTVRTPSVHTRRPYTHPPPWRQPPPLPVPASYSPPPLDSSTPPPSLLPLPLSSVNCAEANPWAPCASGTRAACRCAPRPDLLRVRGRAPVVCWRRKPTAPARTAASGEGAHQLRERPRGHVPPPPTAPHAAPRASPPPPQRMLATCNRTKFGFMHTSCVVRAASSTLRASSGRLRGAGAVLRFQDFVKFVRVSIHYRRSAGGARARHRHGVPSMTTHPPGARARAARSCAPRATPLVSAAADGPRQRRSGLS